MLADFGRARRAYPVVTTCQMIELKFMASDEEFSALAVRAYFREGRVRADRIKEALWGGIAGVVTILLLSPLIWDDYLAWWIYLMVFPLGCLITYWTFRDTVVSRTQKNIRKAFSGKGPFEITYRVGDAKIHVLADGVEHIYQLKDVTWAGKDSEYFDVCLKEKAYHSIPLSAFESDTHQQEFAQALGVPELRDLSNDKTLLSLPQQGRIRDGLQLSVLPWYVTAVASALLGMVVLILNSFSVAGSRAFLNPLSYCAFGMMLFGVILGVVLLVRRK